jgi:hypothetical protein
LQASNFLQQSIHNSLRCALPFFCHKTKFGEGAAPTSSSSSSCFVCCATRFVAAVASAAQILKVVKPTGQTTTAAVVAECIMHEWMSGWGTSGRNKWNRIASSRNRAQTIN